MILKLVVASAALTLATAGPAAAQTTGPSGPTGVKTAEQLVAYMAAHPGDAGLVVLPDRGRATLAVRPGGKFPLASVRKVLTLGALAASGRKPSQAIPRADVERFHLPGTDAGAHEKAKLDPKRPTLAQLAAATAEVSDNAANDALLALVGRRATDRWARRQGMRAQDPVYPFFGEFAAWGGDADWLRRSPAGQAARAAAIAKERKPADVALPEENGLTAKLVAASAAGTPAEWAGLMRRVGTRGPKQLRRTLDWPRRRSPALAKKLDLLLEKGGSLPGVITEVTYVKPKGKPGVAVALFLKDLPEDVYASVLEGFPQQELALALATSPKTVAAVRKALAP